MEHSVEHLPKLRIFTRNQIKFSVKCLLLAGTLAYVLLLSGCGKDNPDPIDLSRFVIEDDFVADREAYLPADYATEEGTFGGTPVRWYIWQQEEMEYYGVSFYEKDALWDALTIVSCAEVGPSSSAEQGIYVGMEENELVSRYGKAFSKTAYEEEAFDLKYTTQYPKSWYARYDNWYLSEMTQPEDELPYRIALGMKDGKVAAITVYYPTAG